MLVIVFYFDDEMAGCVGMILFYWVVGDEVMVVYVIDGCFFVF